MNIGAMVMGRVACEACNCDTKHGHTNPFMVGTEEWRSWNYGWNTYWPEFRG